MPAFPKHTGPHSAASKWFFTERRNTRFLRRSVQILTIIRLGEPANYLLIETDSFFTKWSYNLILTCPHFSAL